MNTALKMQSVALPAIEVGGCSYIDPDAVRAHLDEAYGREWWAKYEALAPDVYVCYLSVRGITRTAVADFNALPDMKNRGTEKFDFLFSQAAYNFGLRSGTASQPAMQTQVIDVTEQIEERDAAVAKALSEEDAGSDTEEAAPVEITDEMIAACLRHAMRLDDDHADKWQTLVANGATDAEIKAMLGEAIGKEGGNSFPFDYAYKGEKNPRIWVGTIIHSRKAPTLAGSAIVAKAREIAGIPTPEEVKAQADEAFAREDGTVIGSLADLVTETAEEVGDSVERVSPVPAAALNDADEPVEETDLQLPPGVVTEAAEVEDVPGVAPASEEEEECTCHADAASGPTVTETDEGADPWAGASPAPGVVASTPVVETAPEPEQVFSEAAAVSQEAAPAPEAAPPTQKMQEVAQFLESQGLKPPTTAAATADGAASAICPVCVKVVLPGLAAKCRANGQIPMHPVCAVNAGK